MDTNQHFGKGKFFRYSPSAQLLELNNFIIMFVCYLFTS